MAAITYWVDPVSGSDANAGTTFGAALETINGAGAKIAAAGDGNDFTVNLTNTSTHAPSSTSTQRSGQATSTIVYRGTDSSGDPAFADVQPGASCGTIFHHEDFASIIVEYLDINLEDHPSTMSILSIGDTTGAAIVRYCKCTYSDIGQPQDTSTKFIVNRTFDTPYADTEVEIYGCYFVNWRPRISNVTHSATMTTEVSYCVFYNEQEGGAGPGVGPLWQANETVHMHHCTQWAKASSGTSVTGVLTGIMANTAFSGDAGHVLLKDNLMWRDSPDAALAVSNTGEFIQGQPPGSATFSSADIGYNIFVTGPNLTAYGTPGDLVNYDGLPFNPGVDDLYDGDQRDDNVADTAVFSDPSSTYDWTPDGSSLAITIDKDLRLIDYTAASSTGGLVGALPAASVNPSIAGSTTAPNSLVEGDTISVTFTYTEDAGDNTDGTTVSLSYPSSFTLNSAKTVNGSVASDVWTITGTSVGGTATLTLDFTVNTNVQGDSLDVTATITAHGSGTGLGGDTGDDAATVEFLGLTIAGGVTNPDSPARVPLVDVIPTVEPRFELDVNIRLKTTRNRERSDYLRYDQEDELFSEYRSAVVNVTTNSSLTFNLGGVERASYMLMESDYAVQLSVNGNSFLPASKQATIAEGAITSLKLKNNSTTNTAEVYVLVVD